MWIAALLLAAGELFDRGLSPVETEARTPAQLSAQTCSPCHAAAHDEWAASRHGRAWTNAIFQREYREQRLEWCVHCHAPLVEQLREVRAPAGGGALAAEGVTCAVCHLRGGRMLAARKRPDSPHDTDVREGFGGPAFCGGCHQFNFPLIEGAGAEARVVGYSAYPMQDTVDQHQRGPLSGRACRECHAQSPGAHAYPGGHDPAMLARAVALQACRQGGELRLTVANAGAGHNVPTGDLHRHLALRAWRPSAPERLHETLFGRAFEAAPGGGKRAVSDTTLPPGAARTVRVPVAPLGAAGARDPIRVELRLVYTIDEFPLRGRELGEPDEHTWATIAERQLDWPSLAPCAPPPAAAARREARR